MKKYKKPYKEKTILQYVVKTVVDTIVVICLAYLIVNLYGTRHIFVGNSMENSIKNQDVLLIDKAIYEFEEPKRFDIIVFNADKVSEGKVFSKRIIGLPGEKVQIKNGKIFINDMDLINDVTDISIFTPGLASEPIVLGEDEYFVLGDNRNNSEDSRFYTIGNVKRENIIGKPWLRVYPLSNFGFVK